MADFKVGDIIRGDGCNPYYNTSKNAIMEVIVAQVLHR